ncbi:MAG TPA: hypothetical protein VKT49_00235 [Bryobacteraceae bacterium]|nr:hypothetical protein [Bryobacteraceae bacterium]
MKWIFALALASAPAWGAISGMVLNGTTGQPQANVPVILMRMGAAGPEDAGQGKTDAQGKFTLNAETSAQGPTLVRAILDGVTYTKVVPPGTPSEGLTLEVYNASKEKGPAKVSKHMIFFDPMPDAMKISEAYLFTNDGKLTWNDPAEGTLHFYLPPSAAGKVRIDATAPGSMPLQEAPIKTNKPDIYKVNFAVRPGETRFDLSYSAAYKEGETFSGKVATSDDSTYLIVPKGVTLTGDNLNDMGVEPRTEAHIYGLKDSSYKISLSGTAQPSAAEAGGDSGSGSQDGAPQIQEMMPRLYTKVGPILGLAFGILALGFVLLYRTPSAKESHDSGHR